LHRNLHEDKKKSHVELQARSRGPVGGKNPMSERRQEQGNKKTEKKKNVGILNIERKRSLVWGARSGLDKAQKGGFLG